MIGKQGLELALELKPLKFSLSFFTNSDVSKEYVVIAVITKSLYKIKD